LGFLFVCLFLRQAPTLTFPGVASGSSQVAAFIGMLYHAWPPFKFFVHQLFFLDQKLFIYQRTWKIMPKIPHIHTVYRASLELPLMMLAIWRTHVGSYCRA
jgi:hypothetical protein